MSLARWLILSSFIYSNAYEINRNVVALAAETTTGGPEVDEKQKPIFGGWIYVGDLQVGCGGALSAVKPTDVSVLFDTGSSVLVLKTQKTFDFVAKEECASIEEMFTEVTGCNAGTCGKCYQHSSCFKDHQKDYQITYGSGPVEVAMGSESITVAGHTVSNVPIGEVTNFNVRTFMRKDFQGIAGLMHNANGAKDGGHSIFQSLRQQGMESFGYCINKEGESKLYWFDDRKLADGARKVPVVCQHHWGVTANALAVGSSDVKPQMRQGLSGNTTRAPALCGGEPCVAILDTGTNFIVGPAPIIEEAVQMITKAGFREDCQFEYKDMPDLVFTLEKDSFRVKPEHYIVEQKMKTTSNVPVKVCALLIGPMEGAIQKDIKVEFSAAKGGSMSNVIILGTPFMRSNYIRFTHPIDKDPYIMIHEKCPEDVSKEEKAKIEKEAVAMQKKKRKQPEGARFVEISAHGDVVNHVSGELPSVIRNQPEESHGAKLVQKNQQVLQQLGGEWVTKDWLALMDQGRECTPGKVMNFTNAGVAEMGAAHAASPMLLLLSTAILAVFNL